MGFWVRNFEGKVWASPFSRTPCTVIRRIGLSSLKFFWWAP